MSYNHELKEYANYPPPWWDNHGSGCVDPFYGVAHSWIKDRIKIKVPFSELCKKFPPTMDESVFAEVLSFISQDGLIFYLFGEPENQNTNIWQIYFDDYTRYPPNIKNPRKETTAFKRWLLKQM